MRGKPFLTNKNGNTITDVKYSWTSESFRHRLWIFGDSYVTIAATRWPYYLYSWKMSDNILISGYAGEASRDGWTDWTETLRYGTPSIAVWCYGMNNPDDNAVNADWLTYTRIFIDDCNARNITPILATIPCTPVVDNSYKNSWVRSSGYRYVEFANAVNTSQDATTWFDNMLDTDNVHPKEAGAIALATAFVEAVPEVMIN